MGTSFGHYYLQIIRSLSLQKSVLMYDLLFRVDLVVNESFQGKIITSTVKFSGA